MTEEIRCTPETFGKLLSAHLQKIQKRTAKAVTKTAQGSPRIIRRRTPKAFGHLQESVHYETGDRVVVDAPHAGAVEQGSAPHTPDFEALVEWVKLRGKQSLLSPSRMNRLGSNSSNQALKVGVLIHELQQQGPGGQFSPADAPEQVARLISKHIQQYGTKPHWFVRSSLPEIERELDKNVKKALGK